MIACGAAAFLFQPGDHGSTFGGNPVTTAASLATIKYIEKNDVLSAVKTHGKQLMYELAMIPGVLEVRGAGLLIGIELSSVNSEKVADGLREAGVLVNTATASTIRIAPALIVSSAQIDSFIAKFRKVMNDVH